MRAIYKFTQIIKRNPEKGTTLIELIIFMGIFSILMIGLFQLMTAVFDSQLEAQSTSSVSQDARYILNKLTSQIKNSDSVVSPIAGSQSATLTTSDGSTTYTYSLSNGNLTLSNSSLGTTDQLNSVNTSISNLSFSTLADTRNKNANTVTIQFTLNSKVLRRGGMQSENYKATVGIR